MSTSAFSIQLTNARDKTWTMDDDGPVDFHKVQEAINAAEEGDTIFVKKTFKSYNEVIIFLECQIICVLHVNL